jgi:hypothetical protein
MIIITSDEADIKFFMTVLILCECQEAGNYACQAWDVRDEALSIALSQNFPYYRKDVRAGNSVAGQLAVICTNRP